MAEVVEMAEVLVLPRNPLNHETSDIQYYRLYRVGFEGSFYAICNRLEDGSFKVFNFIKVDGAELKREGAVGYHPTTRGLPKLIADFRNYIILQDCEILKKEPIHVVHVDYFHNNELVAREFRFEYEYTLFGIEFQYLPAHSVATQIHDSDFPMNSYSNAKWFLNGKEMKNISVEFLINESKLDSFKFIDEQYQKQQFLHRIIEAFLHALKKSHGIGPLFEVIGCAFQKFLIFARLITRDMGSIRLKNITTSKSYLCTSRSLRNESIPNHNIIIEIRQVSLLFPILGFEFSHYPITPMNHPNGLGISNFHHAIIPRYNSFLTLEFNPRYETLTIRSQVETESHASVYYDHDIILQNQLTQLRMELVNKDFWDIERQLVINVWDVCQNSTFAVHKGHPNFGKVCIIVWGFPLNHERRDELDLKDRCLNSKQWDLFEKVCDDCAPKDFNVDLNIIGNDTTDCEQNLEYYLNKIHEYKKLIIPVRASNKRNFNCAVENETSMRFPQKNRSVVNMKPIMIAFHEKFSDLFITKPATNCSAYILSVIQEESTVTKNNDLYGKLINAYEYFTVEELIGTKIDYGFQFDIEYSMKVKTSKQAFVGKFALDFIEFIKQSVNV